MLPWPIACRRLVLSMMLAGLSGTLPVAQEMPGSPSTRAHPTASDRDVAARVSASEHAAEGESEEWTGGEASSGRTFLYKEAVFSGFYSPRGMSGVPPDDEEPDHFEFSPRPPGTYIGLELVRTFSEDSPGDEGSSPAWLSLSAIDLHPRLLFDRMETGTGLKPLKFAPQDFWIRFNVAGKDRWTMRLGQFVLPYGVNPIQAPRQRFLLPIESTDLGLKWDWGLDLKGPAGEYNWETSLTIGSGESLHSPHLLARSSRTSFLWTGRIGAPTYWDTQYGFSFLYGDIPVIRSAQVLSAGSISRWRAGFDAFRKSGTYLMFGGQLTYGEDGFAGDEELVPITGGRTAQVAGYRVWMDWVVPALQDLRLAAQMESIIRDVSTDDSDDTAYIIEMGYSFTTAFTGRIDYRIEANRSSGEENDALYVTLVYYGS
ncbi:MAG: hypothetical protein ACE5HU_00610 [Acidobacteriota bacterium]